MLTFVSLAHTYSHISILALPPVFVLLRIEFGLSGAELGLLVTLISVGMLGQIPLGEVVDRVGAKWPLVAGQALTAVGMAVTALAPSYAWLLLGTAVIGVGQAPIHPANYSLVATVAPTESLGRSFSIHTFGGYAGFALGPLLIGAAAVTIGWRAGMGGLALVGSVYALLLAYFVEPLYAETVSKVSVDKPFDLSTYSGAIVFLGIFFVVIAGAEKAVQAFTPLFVTDGLGKAVTTGSNALSAFFIMTSILVLIGGVLADRYDPRLNIALATAITAFALIGILFYTPTTSVWVYLAFAVAGSGFGLMFASRDKLVRQLSADDAIGRSFGFVFSADAMGGIVAPLVLGIVIDVVSIEIAFTLTAGAFLLAGGLAVAQGRNIPLPTRFSVN
jgi:MFS family permease